ncbi:MAG: hypothetical protein AAFY11_07385 [Cyanobacteria bacterium J06641_5]
MMDLQRYRFKCTLTFGDIYGQIVAWLGVIFVSLAICLATWTSGGKIYYALVTLALVLVLSLPFLLFAFVTTLLNHIEVAPIESPESTPAKAATSQAYGGGSQPATAG